jgi:hypothetical protein
MPKTVVLVVEDEAILRLMAVCVVEDAGFKPIEASNADEAVCILESRNDIRIVFTDINVPGSSVFASFSLPASHWTYTSVGNTSEILPVRCPASSRVSGTSVAFACPRAKKYLNRDAYNHRVLALDR